MNQKQTTFLVNLQTFVPFGSLMQVLPFRFSLMEESCVVDTCGNLFVCMCQVGIQHVEEGCCVCEGGWEGGGNPKM